MDVALIVTLALCATALAELSQDDMFSPQERFRVVRQKTSAVLTDKSFGIVTGKGFWVIKFYAPWCGHCMKLEPEWVRFAKEIDPELNIKVGEVNCAQQKRLENAFSIKGYPTIIMYHDRKVWTYTGGRSAEQLLEYFKQHSPASWLSKPPLLQIPEDSPFLELLTPAQREAKQKGQEEEKEVISAQEIELAKKALPVKLSVLSFSQTVTKGSWIVKVCSKFTKECQNFVPVWLEIVNNVKAKLGSGIRFGEIEANEDFLHEYRIKQVPQILLFRDGQMFRYSKDLSNLVSYLENEWLREIPDAIPSIATHTAEMSTSTLVIRFVIIICGIAGIAYIVNALIAWSNKSKSL